MKSGLTLKKRPFHRNFLQKYDKPQFVEKTGMNIKARFALCFKHEYFINRPLTLFINLFINSSFGFSPLILNPKLK